MVRLVHLCQYKDKINRFFKTHNITKVALICEGYRGFSKYVEGKPED